MNSRSTRDTTFSFLPRETLKKMVDIVMGHTGSLSLTELEQIILLCEAEIEYRQRQVENIQEYEEDETNEINKENQGKRTESRKFNNTRY